MSERPTFEAIYASEFRFVWRILARLGVPTADLADAAQEVFLVLYRQLPQFDGHCKASTWLYRISFNVASDRRRRAHVRREVAYEPQALEELASTFTPQLEDLALLDRLLSGLELSQRAVFVLFEIEGYEGSEIADMMQCPLPTVYSRLRLARAAFEREAARFRASTRPIARRVSS